MTVRQIPFSAPMVRALLEGRKTQTRRLFVPPKPFDVGDDISIQLATGEFKPRYAPGDLLYVREAWRAPDCLDGMSPKAIGEAALDAGYRKPWCPLRFEADEALNSARDWDDFGNRPGTSVPGKYRHARFMPRWASRLTLEVIAVKLERLQDISHEDARAEGVSGCWNSNLGDGYSVTGIEDTWAHSASGAFRKLWDSLNAKRAPWDSNPFVVVPTFTVHKINVDALLAQREAS